MTDNERIAAALPIGAMVRHNGQTETVSCVLSYDGVITVYFASGNKMIPTFGDGFEVLT